MKKMSSGGCLPLPWGFIYMYMAIIFKHLLGNRLASQNKLYMEHSWERGMKVNINVSGHVTKMAAMAIDSKILFKSYSSEPENL